MSSTFPLAKRGYSREKVDRFLADARAAYESDQLNSDFTAEKVRSVGFPMEYNGYEMSAVDAVLERLEAGFVRRERAKVVNEQGEAAWLDKLGAQAAKLYPRMGRPEKERFACAKRGHYGYNKAEVDQFLDELGRYFDGEVEIASSKVRRVLFSRAKGRSAYDMAVVDAYLDRVGEVILGVE